MVCKICDSEWCDAFPVNSDGEDISALCIYTPPGKKVKFIGRNGYDFERKEAAEIFKADVEYTIDEIRIGDWSSRIKFVEVSDKWFNTVMFQNIGE